VKAEISSRKAPKRNDSPPRNAPQAFSAKRPRVRVRPSRVAGASVVTTPAILPHGTDRGPRSQDAIQRIRRVPASRSKDIRGGVPVSFAQGGSICAWNGGVIRREDITKRPLAINSIVQPRARTTDDVNRRSRALAPSNTASESGWRRDRKVHAAMALRECAALKVLSHASAASVGDRWRDHAQGGRQIAREDMLLEAHPRTSTQSWRSIAQIWPIETICAEKLESTRVPFDGRWKIRNELLRGLPSQETVSTDARHSFDRVTVGYHMLSPHCCGQDPGRSIGPYPRHRSRWAGEFGPPPANEVRLNLRRRPILKRCDVSPMSGLRELEHRQGETARPVPGPSVRSRTRSWSDSNCSRGNSQLTTRLSGGKNVRSEVVGERGRRRFQPRPRKLAKYVILRAAEGDPASHTKA